MRAFTLLAVAILLAATDSIAAELNSLSTATVIDFYKRWMKPVATDRHYLNVAKVLKLSFSKRLMKVLIPATLPYMFTGFRLSMGLAWLVIVAVEMLSTRPGVGGFLWQSYNDNVYPPTILCIITIGVVGFALDRVMNLLEKHLFDILALPGIVRRIRAEVGM